MKRRSCACCWKPIGRARHQRALDLSPASEGGTWKIGDVFLDIISQVISHAIRIMAEPKRCVPFAPPGTNMKYEDHIPLCQTEVIFHCHASSREGTF